MNSITAKWFECKVRYATTADGTEKIVTEQYVTDALTFAEAEERINNELTPYSISDIEIKALTIAPYTEVVWAENNTADKWYKARIAIISIDEKTAKELRSTQTILIQAADLNDANDNVDRLFQDTMLDYQKVSVSETKFMDVFLHKVTE